MVRWRNLALVLIAVLLGVAIYAHAATNGVLFGSGNADSSFQIDTASKAIFGRSFAANGPASVQTCAAGCTIASDSCGGMKQVQAAGAVSTDATNPFTAATTATAGCTMLVCNTSAGANTITVKHAANFLSQAGADVALAQNTCLLVGNDGTIWRQGAGLQTDS